MKYSRLIARIAILGVLVFAQTSFVYASQNTLTVSASAKEVTVGDSVTVTVIASSPDQQMNAASGTLNSDQSVSLVQVSKQKSVINFWTQDPQTAASGGRIHFEGVIITPGYQGKNGIILSATYIAKRAGVATFSITDGALLANDGLGTNIIDALGSVTVKIADKQQPQNTEEGQNSLSTKPSPQQNAGVTVLPSGRKVALPVITEFSSSVGGSGVLFLRGKGQPNAITRIGFTNAQERSLGEQFVVSLQTKKNILDSVLVKNAADGTFEYVSPSNLVAGAYNATPYLVDEKEQTEKPGFGVKVLVTDSPVVKRLIVLINILILLIPIVGLVVLIYFIPWYSRLRMRLIQRRLHLEEEKIHLSETEVLQAEKRVEK